MEQRDWELLDKQVWGLRHPRSDGVNVLTVVAVFFAGVILGGLLVPHESELVRIASNDARAAILLPNGAAPTAWRQLVENEIRVNEIDTTGGPGFGFEHIKQYDFLRDKEFGFEHLLRDKEIVLTFDDGPWPRVQKSSE